MSELRQREPTLKVPGLTETARDKPCTMLVPGICLYLSQGRTDTTVWSHSNEDQHGKGVGKKAHDPFGAYACHACHDWYDRGRDPERHEFHRKARDRSLLILFRQHLKVLR